MTQLTAKTQQQALQILDILNNVSESILSILMPDKFIMPGYDEQQKAKQLKLIAIENKVKNLPTNRGYHSRKQTNYEFRIKPEHQAALLKAIEIGGNIHNLAHLSGCLPIRIYDVTKGRCSSISAKLAYQIEMGTNGQVKASELTDKILD